MKILKVLLLAISLPLTVFAMNTFQVVSTENSENEFVAVYKFQQAVDPSKVSIQLLENSIEVKLPETQMPTDKNLLSVDEKAVKSIYTVQEEGQVMISKIILPEGVKATLYENQTAVSADGSTLRIALKSPTVPAESVEAAPQEKAEDVAKAEAADKPADATENTDNQPLVKSFENKISTQKTAAVTKPSTADKSEAEIPVLAGIKDKKSESSGSLSRILMSFVIVFLFAAALFAFLRWYAKRNKTNAINNQIRILNQHYLGPRKSLAIIRVAGETMLIGISDHNISMLKTLSLMDEDLPGEMSDRFDSALEKATAQAQGEAEDHTDHFILSNIKDKVSEKIRNMRNI